MIRAGLRLRWFDRGDPDFTVSDLLAFVSGLPRDSALVRAQLGDDAEWDLRNDLLALMVDQLAMFRYQMTGDESTPKPVFVSRGLQQQEPDVVEPDSAPVDLNKRNQSGVLSGEVTSTAEIAQRLGWV